MIHRQRLLLRRSRLPLPLQPIPALFLFFLYLLSDECVVEVAMGFFSSANTVNERRGFTRMPSPLMKMLIQGDLSHVSCSCRSEVQRTGCNSKCNAVSKQLEAMYTTMNKKSRCTDLLLLALHRKRKILDTIMMMATTKNSHDNEKQSNANSQNHHSSSYSTPRDDTNIPSSYRGTNDVPTENQQSNVDLSETSLRIDKEDDEEEEAKFFFDNELKKEEEADGEEPALLFGLEPKKKGLDSLDNGLIFLGPIILGIQLYIMAIMFGFVDGDITDL